MFFLKKNLLLKLVLLILLISRLSLIGKGCLEDSDELPFIFLLENLTKLISLDIESWLNMVFHAHSSLLETFFRLVQSFFLIQYAKFNDLPITSSNSLIVMTFFNIITTTLISLVFYKILIRLGFNYLFSILGVIILSTFVNTNLYIRHILAYDTALLFNLLGLYVVLKEHLNKRGIIISGFFICIAYFTYVGYFLFIPSVLFLIIIKFPLKIKGIVQKTALFFIPFCIFLIIIEFFSYSIGESYINNSILFASTITQGTPKESLVFVFKYFNEVEGIWGILMLILFFTGFLMNFVSKKIYTPLNYLILVFTFSYILYGLFAYFSNSLVFYGRILHMFYPIIVIGILIFLKEIKILAPIILVFALINFQIILKDLNHIDYPRSLIYEYNLFNINNNLIFKNELENAVVYDSNITNLIEVPKNIKPSDNKTFILKNFCFFYHFPNEFMDTYVPFTKTGNTTLLISKNHFMSHPAYSFEYTSKEGRAFFKEKEFKIEVYEIND